VKVLSDDKIKVSIDVIPSTTHYPKQLEHLFVKKRKGKKTRRRRRSIMETLLNLVLLASL